MNTTNTQSRATGTGVSEASRPAHDTHTLRLVDLSVTFRGFEGTARVVDRANLEVTTGELIGIVGETGCGKSVLMRSMLDLLPTPPAQIEGSVEFDGTNLRGLSPRARRAVVLAHFNMVFQDPVGSLNPVFTVGSQMREVLQQASRRAHQRLSRGQLDERAITLLRRVQLDDPERVLRAYSFQLSGGMNQRISIALALSTDPWLIVADEPTTALDVTVQAEILSLFTRLVREEGRSALLITHSMGVVRTVTDRVAVMYAGVVVEQASTEELFANPRHPYTVALLECVPRLTGQVMAKGIPGTLPNYTAAPSGCRFHPRCPHAMPICAESRPPAFAVGQGDHRVACWLYDGR
ncbi:MAG TPA: ABC transporter ATP-binding protein [Chloroflexota bacterium]|nr:ABC transporter ATP-binding protein [Chloroflexota bacterium]